MVNRIVRSLVAASVLSAVSCTSTSVSVVYSPSINRIGNSSFYAKYRDGVTATENRAGNVVGVSKCQCFFGVISTGDASIYKAMENGRISEISYVDQEIFQVTFFPISTWSIFEEYKTIVVGR
ncbi:MAG: TRL domain-containing protein [Spirochaetota bacterium]